jgi:hypothetical protein
MQRNLIKSAMLAMMLAAVVAAVGCKVEWKRSPEELQKQADSQRAPTAVVELPVPSTDDAALVIAACGPATSDQIMTINDRTSSRQVRRMVYRGGRETTLDFIPLQKTNSANNDSAHTAPASNTIWRFDEAVVDNQKLLTAANIRVYLPCAANALAKEF